MKRILKCHPIKFLGGNSGFDPVEKKWKIKMFAAVVLSTFVIMMWQFCTANLCLKHKIKNKFSKQQLKGDKPSAPSISQKKVETKLTRSDAINQGTE